MPHNMPDPDASSCKCLFLERASRDEKIPVVFDEQMNEYHLVHLDGRGYSMFYHCPLCGGRVPETRRAAFWTEVSMEESFRLHELTKDIKTPDELFARFGKPDSDFEVSGGCTSAGSEKEPPETTLGPRRVVFRSLSDTADVNVKIDRYDRLRFSFSGRYIGPKRDAAE